MSTIYLGRYFHLIAPALGRWQRGAHAYLLTCLPTYLHIHKHMCASLPTCLPNVSSIFIYIRHTEASSRPRMAAASEAATAAPLQTPIHPRGKHGLCVSKKACSKFTTSKKGRQTHHRKVCPSVCLSVCRLGSRTQSPSLGLPRAAA